MITNNRLWVGVATIVAMVILLGGWFLGVSPLLTSASVATADRESVEAQNATQEVALDSLKTRFASISVLQSSLDSIRDSLPATADMPTFLRQLDAAATANGVTVSTFGVTDAAGFSSTAVEAAAVDGTADVTDEGSPDGEGVGATAAAAATPAADASPPAPSIVDSDLVTADNFVTVPITMTVSGPYDRVMALLNDLQAGERLFLVTAFDGAADPEADYVLNLEGLIYSLLDTDTVSVQPMTSPDVSTATLE